VEIFSEIGSDMTTGIFIDTHSLYFELRRKYGKKLSLKAIDKFCSDFGTLNGRHAYGIHIRGQAIPFITAAQKLGYNADWWNISVKDKGIVNNISRITRDLLLIKYDRVILCTRDRNYLPVIDYLISQGVKVIILGCNLHNSFSSASTIEIPESLTE